MSPKSKKFADPSGVLGVVASSSGGPLPCSILLLLDATLMLLPRPDSDLRVQGSPPGSELFCTGIEKAAFRLVRISDRLPAATLRLLEVSKHAQRGSAEVQKHVRELVSYVEKDPSCTSLAHILCSPRRRVSCAAAISTTQQPQCTNRCEGTPRAMLAHVCQKKTKKGVGARGRSP